MTMLKFGKVLKTSQKQKFVKLDPSSNKLDPSSNKLDPSSNKLVPSSNKLDPSSNKLVPSSTVSIIIKSLSLSIDHETAKSNIVLNIVNHCLKTFIIKP